MPGDAEEYHHRNSHRKQANNTQLRKTPRQDTQDDDPADSHDRIAVQKNAFPFTVDDRKVLSSNASVRRYVGILVEQQEIVDKKKGDQRDNACLY